jgi:hypothetical protein
VGKLDRNGIGGLDQTRHCEQNGAEKYPGKREHSHFPFVVVIGPQNANGFSSGESACR